MKKKHMKPHPLQPQPRLHPLWLKEPSLPKQRFVFRLLVTLVFVLSIAAGLGWEMLKQIEFGRQAAWWITQELEQ